MDLSFETAVASLLEHWTSESPPYERTVVHGEVEIQRLETRFGITLPGAFRTYLLTACSTFDDGGCLDHSGNAWWGLDRIDTVRGGYKHDLNTAVLSDEAATSLIFADHMIWCMAWAICCGQGPNYGKVFIIDESARFVADDFEVFIAGYINEPSRLL